MLFGILVFFFIVVCVVLIFLVLVQSDKGGGLSGAIGGGVSTNANSVLGSQNTENILTQGTKIFAALFFILTIAMSFLVMSSGKTTSTSAVKEHVASTVEAYAPSAPASPTAIPAIQQPQETIPVPVAAPVVE